MSNFGKLSSLSAVRFFENADLYAKELYDDFEEFVDAFQERQDFMKRPPIRDRQNVFLSFALGYCQEVTRRYDCPFRTIQDAENWVGNQITDRIVGHGVVAPDVTLGKIYRTGIIKEWWIKSQQEIYDICMELLYEHELEKLRKRYKR